MALLPIDAEAPARTRARAPHRATPTLRSASRAAALALSLGVLAASACTLITDVDRSKIPQLQRPPFPEVDGGGFDAGLLVPDGGGVEEVSNPDAAAPAPDSGDVAQNPTDRTDAGSGDGGALDPS
jgi:hypothetical protein